MPKNSPVTIDAWGRLRHATSARVALGRAGGSLPTREWLDFQAAHAAARDAVHQVFDADELAKELAPLGIETVLVDSAATNRGEYLQRPDLGRRLAPHSAGLLDQRHRAGDLLDLAITVSDGLSALAAHRQAPALLAELWPKLTAGGWHMGPLVIARYGRVALQDEIGQRLGAKLALMFIGERPGLGSPDSLGAYLVYDPRPGNTDVCRNCVSNIRPEGASASVAADTLFHLLNEARRLRISGVTLKDQRMLASTARLDSGN